MCWGTPSAPSVARFRSMRLGNSQLFIGVFRDVVPPHPPSTPLYPPVVWSRMEWLMIPLLLIPGGMHP